ncbi:DUF4280 domain-containing protein [Paenibacillus oralis]|uniref:DUF4280 domain-containing protein n=1 Tax=Paenibacillus oralis TaxID=2490856 RepID=A0A3P3TVU3_9BACL|nr:DUF4280 domain-containing protein [Paenibacillus oralis]RRJ61874.1 DUF4280 domain-containing protein [Paenibacillus oralis]
MSGTYNQDKLIMLGKARIHELNTAWRDTETYITSGAYMQCSCGTHEEVLNRVTNNGVYINKNPMMTVRDCKVSTSKIKEGDKALEELEGNIDGNLYSFGYCRSDRHPAFIKGEQTAPGAYGGEVDYDVDSGTNIPGKFIYPCIPEFVTRLSGPTSDSSMCIQPEWQNGSKTVSIDGVPVLTSKSCLTCVKGGQITFLTNGMDMPPLDFVKHYVK